MYSVSFVYIPLTDCLLDLLHHFTCLLSRPKALRSVITVSVPLAGHLLPFIGLFIINTKLQIDRCGPRQRGVCYPIKSGLFVYLHIIGNVSLGFTDPYQESCLSPSSLFRLFLYCSCTMFEFGMGGEWVKGFCYVWYFFSLLCI